MKARNSRTLLAVALLGLLSGSAAIAVIPPAEDPEGAAAEATEAEEAVPPSFFSNITVTATGSEADVFEITTPVTVIRAEEIQMRAPDNAAELLRNEPGVDVNGVGPNQGRPVIRGLRGLRVLFLEDGMRLNNARRQTDFGEITGLVDVEQIGKLEVVRGPASVLYGTDAIGGVLNLVTSAPSFGDGKRFGGRLGLRYGSSGEQERGHLDLAGSFERLAYSLGYTHRDANDYEAPSGTFGDIVLDDEVVVRDSGVRDESLGGYLGYRLSDGSSLSGRFTRYRAEQAGFGFVDPEAIGDTSGFRIRILYPFQDFDKLSLFYDAVDLDTSLASTLEVRTFYQNNERQLANDIEIDIGPLFPGAPSSDVHAETLNFSDLETFGLRAELTKTLAENKLLTYGLDYYQDDSFNTDSSTTTTTLRFFPGPFGERVSVSTDDVANSPNAENVNFGLFVQGDVLATDRLTTSLGLRYARTQTRAKATPGWDVSGLDFADDAVVGAASVTYRINDRVNLVGSVGRAFRAPNIIERLFNGATPEGAGFQVLNPELEAEQSTNVDLGVKYRGRRAFLEAMLFTNDVNKAIIQHTLTDEEIADLPPDVRATIQQLGIDFIVQQRNADVLKIEGFEVAGAYRWDSGISTGGNYTHLSGQSENGGAAADPTGETFSDKVNLYLRYEPSTRPFWTEYRIRHNGQQDAALDPGQQPGPLGVVLPSFTIHSLAGGYSLNTKTAGTHQIGLIVANLTDELYAEFTNASFFRPQPRRSVLLSYGWRF